MTSASVPEPVLTHGLHLSGSPQPCPATPASGTGLWRDGAGSMTEPSC
jgi:hypothetical protein